MQIRKSAIQQTRRSALRLRADRKAETGFTVEREGLGVIKSRIGNLPVGLDATGMSLGYAL
jgi:hypothetical protein